MRDFPYNTVGTILERLEKEGLKISRLTLYRLEERLDLPGERTKSETHKWRVYTDEQVTEITETIKKYYNFESTKVSK